jgi:hypothetical protein
MAASQEIGESDTPMSKPGSPSRHQPAAAEPVLRIAFAIVA